MKSFPLDAAASNSDRPKAHLKALQMRYGFRSDGSKNPTVVFIHGPKVERWERISGDLFVMIDP